MPQAHNTQTNDANQVRPDAPMYQGRAIINGIEVRYRGQRIDSKVARFDFRDTRRGSGATGRYGEFFITQLGGLHHFVHFAPPVEAVKIAGDFILGGMR